MTRNPANKQDPPRCHGCYHLVHAASASADDLDRGLALAPALAPALYALALRFLVVE
jgi:hypothetical protein